MYNMRIYSKIINKQEMMFYDAVKAFDNDILKNIMAHKNQYHCKHSIKNCWEENCKELSIEAYLIYMFANF